MEINELKEKLKFKKLLLKKARLEKDLQEVYNIKLDIKLLKCFIKLERRKKHAT